MDFELWYLVAVPGLFAAGWWLRGLDARQRKAETQGLDDNYFKGLSLLLSDEPDKAIDLFIEVVRLDPETIELHHALGNLFRRRGEFDRAIRIHNYLVNRGELLEPERAKALSELALDFLKAGMYDRAEVAYEALSKVSERRVEALAALKRIYCTEKEWQKAIDTAQLLEREAGHDQHVEISHYYCELARLSWRAKDRTRALELARKAMETDRESVRALALSADLCFEAGQTARAMGYWQCIEKEKPSYLPLVAAKMADVMATESREQALAFLKKTFDQTGSVDVLDAYVRRILEWQGEQQAVEAATAALKMTPTLSVFAILCSVRHKLSPDNAETELLASITARQAKKLSRYQCSHCGFMAHTFSWQCPGCESWASFPPCRVEDSKKASGY